MIDNERYMHLWVWERCIHNDTRMKRGYISILLKRVVYVPFMNVVLNSLVICFHLLCFLVFAYSLHFLASPCILQLWSSCWIPRPLLDFASLSAHMTFVKHVTYLKLGLAVGKIDVMYWQGSIPYMKWFLNREIAWTRRPSHATIHYTSVCKGEQPWVASYCYMLLTPLFARERNHGLLWFPERAYICRIPCPISFHVAV